MCISCAFSSPSFNTAETGIILHSFVDTGKCHAAAPTIPVGPLSCSSPSKKTSETLREFRAY